MSDTALNIAYGSRKIADGIDRIAQGILKRHPDPGELALLAVHSGGNLILRRIEESLARQGGFNELSLDKGLVEISFYRDDWSRLSQLPRLQATDIRFDVDDRRLLLIDDVIFTGRTIRAALEAIFSLGRPSAIELAVLVDRGHRELPIAPDYIGLSLPTRREQGVNVFLFEDANLDHATLEDNKYQTRKAS